MAVKWYWDGLLPCFDCQKSQTFHYGGILTTERIDPLQLMSQCMWPPPCWCTTRGCVYRQMHWAWTSSVLTENLLACISSNYLISPSVFQYSFFIRLNAALQCSSNAKSTARLQLPIQNCHSELLLWYTNMAAVGVAIYRSLQKHYTMRWVYLYFCVMRSLKVMSWP